MLVCEFCRQPMPAGSHFCGACGRLTSAVETGPIPGISPASLSVAQTSSLLAGDLARPVYAGFWRRLLAWLIDYAVFLAFMFFVLVAAGFVLGIVTVASGRANLNQKELEPFFAGLSYLVGIPSYLLYYALLESSRWQATLGKKALGIAVTDLEGKRISFKRAAGRNLAKILSSLVFCAGFVMAAFSEKKQALHDRVTDCLVFKKI